MGFNTTRRGVGYDSSSANTTLDWTRDAKSIVSEIQNSDQYHGVRAKILNKEYLLFGAQYTEVSGSEPGLLIDVKQDAVCVSASNGSVWVSNLKPYPDGIKLPAFRYISQFVDDEIISPPESYYKDIEYYVEHKVAYIQTNFYNGVMNVSQCERLRDVIRQLKKTDCKIITILGNAHQWNNGMHLNEIEYAEDSVEATWNNIHAINTLIEECIRTKDQLLISALEGDACLGGACLALTSDIIIMHESAAISFPFKVFGGYCGTYYHTYLLPKKVGQMRYKQIIEGDSSLSAKKAMNIGLINEVVFESKDQFKSKIKDLCKGLAKSPYLNRLIQSKMEELRQDEKEKSLLEYIDDELKAIRELVSDVNSLYHLARSRFVLSQQGDYSELRNRSTSLSRI